MADASGRILGEADAIAPRKTPLSSMTPTIVLHNGKPFLILGSPGSQTIINTVLEVMVNVIDWKMNVQDAVNWPRFHHAWMPDVLQMEPGEVGLYGEVRGKAGRLRGHPVHRRMARGRCRSAHRRIGGRILISR